MPASDIAFRVSGRFNGLFAVSARTVMIGGGSEPLFLPATADQPARLVFTRDYASSALHEAAHWCIAGTERRRKIDYGYTYCAPPRSEAQQQRFFELELRCQALELIFAQAAGQPFQISLDNLDAAPTSAADFARLVRTSAAAMTGSALPPRARRLRDALASEFNARPVAAHPVAADTVTALG